MKQWSDRARESHKTIGLVTTMGSLHDGHMSLVQKSVSTCDVTVVSIFINPTQFGKNEDPDKYPQDLEGDRRQLESAGVDVLFLPSRSDMYPEGYKTFVIVEGITDTDQANSTGPGTNKRKLRGYRANGETFSRESAPKEKGSGSRIKQAKCA